MKVFMKLERMVTHDEHVAKYADNIVYMKDGVLYRK
jgi:ABC-type lipoprotein export system ATPase subunit